MSTFQQSTLQKKAFFCRVDIFTPILGLKWNQENSVERPPLQRPPLFLEKFSIPLCLAYRKVQGYKDPPSNRENFRQGGVFLLNSPDTKQLILHRKLFGKSKQTNFSSTFTTFYYIPFWFLTTFSKIETQLHITKQFILDTKQLCQFWLQQFFLKFYYILLLFHFLLLFTTFSLFTTF